MSDTNAQAGEKLTEGFGTRELTVLAETASSAVAAQAVEQVRARYIMAMQRPRDWDAVRTRLLKECRRPSFAAVARYRKPIGAGVEGPSIRFAEAALRCMGNVLPETTAVYDDNQKRIVRVSVTDLESNLTYAADVVIPKTVERRKLGKGQVPISQRSNSYGDLVYIVEATDDDLLNKVNALVSKALRTLALRVLPGDILDECMREVVRIVEQEIKDDPDAARKAIADSFQSLGVSPDRLAEYLWHPLAESSPPEIAELRALFAAIRDGEASFVDALESKRAPADGEQKPDPKVGALRAKLDAAKKKPAAGTKSTAPSAAPEGPASSLGVSEEPGGAVSPFNAEGQCRMCFRAEADVADFGHEKGCHWETKA